MSAFLTFKNENCNAHRIVDDGAAKRTSSNAESTHVTSAFIKVENSRKRTEIYRKYAFF